MYILGVNAASHNASACLIGDGRLLAFVEEERFDRIKYSTAFPIHAIEYCLAEAGIGIGDVDAVALAGVPRREIVLSARAWFRHVFRPWYRWWLRNQILVTGFYKDHRQRSRLRGKLEFGGALHYVEHHLCHASSAFHISPYDSAAILTVDAQGDGLASAIYHGQGTRIRRVAAYRFPETSLGHFYDCVAEFTGFRPIKDAGKVMGLSSYGDPGAYGNRFARLVTMNSGGSVRFDLDYMKHERGMRSCGKFVREFGPPRERHEPPTEERFANAAASAQAVLERAMVHLAAHAKDLTGERNLCIAGGVGLNSVANGIVLREGIFDDVWIQPAANDAGLALGAAFGAWHEHHDGARNFVMDHAYWGPGFTDEEIRAELEVSKLPFREIADPAETAASLVAKDRIVGWFQGRMEAGPRALGNRSIIANPRRAEMKDIVNRYVKHRESFRPFAPSALEERAPEYFDVDRPVPFMLVISDVLPEKRDEIPAITHVDGTARLQTVSRKENAAYHRMIEKFGEKTGTPVILNTSFNIKGEPIVCTPGDALRCYYSTGIDDLVIGRYHVKKSGS
jgi:carbamoyltransferase